MLTNIRSTITDIIEAFDSGTKLTAVEDIIHEEFSDFELRTLNESLGKLSRYQRIDLTHPNNRPATMSELTEKFFILVAQEM